MPSARGNEGVRVYLNLLIELLLIILFFSLMRHNLMQVKNSHIFSNIIIISFVYNNIYAQSFVY